MKYIRLVIKLLDLFLVKIFMVVVVLLFVVLGMLKIKFFNEVVCDIC